MEWFRQNYGAALEKESIHPEHSLPSADGIVLGLLRSIKVKSKDGVIVCGAAAESWAECEVFIFREILAACEASVGDRLGFHIHKNVEGKPQTSFPIWREVSCHSGSPKDCDILFPKTVGIVERISPSGDFGYVQAPHALGLDGKSIFVQKSLLGGVVSVGDVVAFDVRLNSKGNPQAAAPLFKCFIGKSTSGNKFHSLKPVKPLTVRRLKGDLLIADWAGLPSELLPRVLATSGPVELCRLVAVCQEWHIAVTHAESGLECFWQALCAEMFPSMTKKLLVSSESGVAASNECDSSAQKDSENDEERDDEKEEILGGDDISTTISEVKRHGKFNPPPRKDMGRKAVGFWRHMFLQRYLKQCAWDHQRSSHRQEQLRKSELLQQQALVEDKQRGKNFRGQASQSEAKTQRTMRSVRQRTCKKCGCSYVPGSGNAADACWWHRGSYSCVDDDGVLAASGCQINQAVIQRAIQENTKKKRKPILLRPPGTTTGRWIWTCCNAENMLATGCCSGPHL